MSTIIGDPGSALVGGNTGNPSADISPKEPIGFILSPKVEIVNADLATEATFIAQMQEMIMNPHETRAYPFFRVELESDNTEADVTEKLKYGSEFFVRNGKPGWTFVIPGAGVGFWKEARKHSHTKSKTVYMIDSDYFLWGVRTSTGIRGFRIDEINFEGIKIADGSKSTKFMVRLMLADAKEWNDQIDFVRLYSAPDELFKGIIDIDLVQVNLTANASILIRVVEKISRVNLYAQYSTLLNSLTAWTVTKAGSVVTPASIALSAANEGFMLTLTTPTGDHVFTLKSASALDVLGIGGTPENGFESNTLTATFSQT